MDKFIRFDEVGHWRGAGHRSSFQGDGERMEAGISCYKIWPGQEAEAIENLCDHWMENNSRRTPGDYEGLQVTIFKGEKLPGMGADWEDVAECTSTVAELNAVEFMTTFLGTQERLEDGGISIEEYKKIITNLIKLPLPGHR
ncbi:hypothetical protein ACE41H_21420 [Paenibacillus enshidis]|uniref:Uncharacterized protein n=1 Tax=Paenibacillus enshidis TaxID=1458439 RepID=A0ABV5AYM5_9BACL